MSWNPRLKARWAREEEASRKKAKIIQKTPISTELKEMLTALLSRQGELDQATIEKELHLDTMGKIRLSTILKSCEEEKIIVRKITGDRVMFKTK